MKIGIFGFTLTHENMGCQALTCAFLEMLRQACLDEHMEIIVFRSDKTLGLIPELFPEMSFKLVRITFHDIRLSMFKEIKKCDVIFDETYGDGFSDIYFTKTVYRDTLIKCITALSKKPFILTPQTYGPFKDKKLEWLASIAIRYATRVYSRDQLSADYATKISKREVMTVTDLAFTLPFKNALPKQEKKRFGLNISGLLWQGGFGKENQFGLKTDYKKYCSELIENMLERGYEVYLIPHVTVPAEDGKTIPDGDYPYCQELKEQIPDAILAPNFPTPYNAKNYISSMDIFVGARMHSTIGAFSAGVVTIPFAYSRKFQGLFDTLNYAYYVDGTKLTTSQALEMTYKYVEDANKLREAIQNSRKEIVKNTETFRRELKDVLNLVRKGTL